jgi:hypothetical protein
MTKNEIFNRIQNLILAHSWSNHHNQILSRGQRICLSQERAALMECMEFYHFGVKPKYTIPKHLEVKLQVILNHINQTNWTIPNYEKEPY